MADRRTTKKRPVRSLGRKQIITPEKKSRFRAFSDFFRLGESYSSLILGIIVVIAAASLLVSFARTNPKAPEISKKDISATNTTNTEITITPIVTDQSDSTIPTPTVTKQQEPTPTVKPTVVPTSIATPTTQPISISQGTTYTVQAGDDLWKIAEKTYNDGYQWKRIAEANNLTDPNRLTAGTKLTLPQVQAIARTTVTPAPKVTATPTIVAKVDNSPTPSLSDKNRPTGPPQEAITGSTYTVKPGDSLWDIAVRTYGNGYKWVDIARANNLQNPNIIHTGNVFALPKKG
jgi:nucleoid-associated protein YgaU